MSLQERIARSDDTLAAVPAKPAWPLPDRILTIGAVLIICAGVAMRLYHLGSQPGGLFSDEAYYGWDALSVLRGAHPIYFPANNGREPFFIYLMAGTIGIFGRNPLGVRAAAAVCGLLTIPATYLLGRAWGNRRVGRLSAAILSVTVWHIHLSRVGFRAVSLPLFLALALAAAALALRSRERRWAIAAGLAYGLSAYTYLAARFTPVAVLALAAIAFPRHRSRLAARRATLSWMLLMAVLTVAPLAYYGATHPDVFLDRSSQLAVWSGGTPPGNPLRAVVASTWRTLGMFVWRGDYNPRHNVPHRPVFDPLMAACFLAGVGMALSGWRRRPALARAVTWTGVMCLPTLMSIDAPHFLRAAGALPIVVLIPALALDEGLRMLERRLGMGERRGIGGSCQPAQPGLMTLASVALVAVLAASAAFSARDYFGWPVAPSVRHAGFDYQRRYLADPQTTAAFQGDLTELAATANSAPGTLYLDRGYPDSFLPMRFLLTRTERLALYEPGQPLPPGRPPCTLIAWLDGGLGGALKVLPSPAQITVALGPLGRQEQKGPSVPLYGRWLAEPLASEPKLLAHPLARFKGGLELIDTQATPTRSGRTVRLRWRRNGAAVSPAAVTVEAVAATGAVLARKEEPVGTAYYPPALWPTGSVIIQRVRLSSTQIRTSSLRLRLRDLRSRQPVDMEGADRQADGDGLVVPWKGDDRGSGL